MSELRKAEEGKLYFATLTVAGWIDVFNRREYLDELIESIKFCQKKKGLLLYCYVIMPSHMHIIAARHGARLGDVLRDLKSYTATSLFDIIDKHPGESRKEWMQYLFKYFGRGVNQERQFWQHTNHPIELYSPKVISQKVEYIHNNPVKAGIVSQPEHCLYSSAHPEGPLDCLPLGSLLWNGL
jgi:putative transposase